MLAKLAASAALWAPLKASSSAHVSVAPPPPVVVVVVGRWCDDEEPLATDPSGRSSLLPSGVMGACRETLFPEQVLVEPGCSIVTVGASSIPGSLLLELPALTLRQEGLLGDAARSTSETSGLACGGRASMWQHSVAAASSQVSSNSAGSAAADEVGDDEQDDPDSDEQ